MKPTQIQTAMILCMILFFPFNSLAQIGSLDLSFDNDGIVTSPIGISDDAASSVAIQSDMKIVVAGYSFVGANMDFALARYNPNGDLDSSFGINGRVTTDMGSNIESSMSIVIQPDGKILVVGYDNTNFALARYNTNGSLDSSFDFDGKVITPIGSVAGAFGVTMQSDGKIVVAGFSNNDFALARYNIDGSLDSTFDADGIVITPFAGNDRAKTVAIQTDGKIIAGGFSTVETKCFFASARYNQDGTLDTTFDTDGKVTTSITATSIDEVNSIDIQTDGKIVMVGTASNLPNATIALVRYNIDGSLDNTFDNDGIVTIYNFMHGEGKSVEIQSDGKILVGGFGSIGTSNMFVLLRYQSNGDVDSTFDLDGIVTTTIGMSSMGYSIALQPDGKIVMAGLSENGSDKDFALARYINNIGTSLIDYPKIEMKVYPNPFISSAILKSNLPLKRATLIVYNIYGKLIKELNNLYGNTINFQRDDLQKGVYYIQLKEDNKIISKNKLLIID